jgi:hypothetical protein
MTHSSKSEPVSAISALPPGALRPRWSVVIPVYNRTEYLAQALGSVLVQDPGVERMQVCLVDNSSVAIDWSASLSPAQLARVELHRNPRTLPVHENWNRCIELARGTLVHLLHDDDWVEPDFYRCVEQMRSESPEAGMFAVRSFEVDAAGIIEHVTRNCLDSRAVSRDLRAFFPRNPLQCPGVVVQRFAYEALGGFRGDMGYVIDLEMWIRIVASFGIRFSHRILSSYRVSAGNGTHVVRQTGQNLRDLLAFSQLITARHPELQAVDWRAHLLAFARAQEASCRQQGEGSAAAHARRFWFQHATPARRLLRHCQELYAVLARRR